MRLGCFGYAEHIDIAEKIGFDSIELDLTPIYEMNTEDFNILKDKIYNSNMNVDVFSGLIPLSVRIHDKDFDRNYWLERIDQTLELAAELGGKIIPFGAGKCRSIPEISDATSAKRRVKFFVQDLCDLYLKYNLEMAIEPLGFPYSNYINTIEEAADFIKFVDRQNCKIMCDLRHMVNTGDAFSNIVSFKEYIIHAHVDYPIGSRRIFPARLDGYDYSKYFAALKNAEYNGILTIEATEYCDFGKEGEEGIKVLKNYFHNHVTHSIDRE